MALHGKHRGKLADSLPKRKPLKLKPKNKGKKKSAKGR